MITLGLKSAVVGDVSVLVATFTMSRREEEESSAFIDFNIRDDVEGVVLVEVKDYYVDGTSTYEIPITSKSKEKYTLSCDSKSSTPIEVIWEQEAVEPVYPDNSIIVSGYLVKETFSAIQLTMGEEISEPISVIYSNGVTETYSDGLDLTINLALDLDYSAIKEEGAFEVLIELGNNKCQLLALNFSSDNLEGDGYSIEKYGSLSLKYLNSDDLNTLMMVNTVYEAGFLYNVPNLFNIDIGFAGFIKTIPAGLFEGFERFLPAITDYCADPLIVPSLKEFGTPMTFRINGSGINELPEKFFKPLGVHLSSGVIRFDLTTLYKAELKLPDDIFDYVDIDVATGEVLDGLIHMDSLPGLCGGEPTLIYSDSILSKVGSIGDTNGFFNGMTEIPERLFSNTLIRGIGRDGNNNTSIFAGGTFTSIPKSLLDATKANVTDDPAYKFEGDVPLILTKNGIPHPTVLVKNSVNTPIIIGEMFSGCDKLVEIPEGLFDGLYIKGKSHEYDEENNQILYEDAQYVDSESFNGCTSLTGTIKNYIKAVFSKAKNQPTHPRSFSGCTSLEDYEEAQTKYPDWV